VNNEVSLSIILKFPKFILQAQGSLTDHVKLWGQIQAPLKLSKL